MIILQLQNTVVTVLPGPGPADEDRTTQTPADPVDLSNLDREEVTRNVSDALAEAGDGWLAC